MLSDSKSNTKGSENGSSTKKNAILETLDNAKFSVFHIIAVIVAGMGFFADAYDLFVISLLTKLIGRLYYPDVQYYSHAHCLSMGITDSHCGSKYQTLANYLNSTMPDGFSDSLALAHVPSAMPANIDAAIK